MSESVSRCVADEKSSIPNCHIVSDHGEMPVSPLDWDVTPELANSLLYRFCKMFDVCGSVDWEQINTYDKFLTLAGSWFSGFGQWVGAIAGVLGVVVTVVGFIFVWRQIRDQKQALETQTSWTMYEASLAVLNTFVENPELRPFFYEKQSLPEEGLMRHKVLAAAEVVADHLENIVSSGECGAIDVDTYYVWVKYMWLIGLRSEVMQEFLMDTRESNGSVEPAEGIRYSDMFKKIVRNRDLPPRCEPLYYADSVEHLALLKPAHLTQGFWGQSLVFLKQDWRIPVGVTQNPWNLFVFLLYQWIWWLVRGIFSTLILFPLWLGYRLVFQR